MQQSQSPIFRKNALHNYMKGREETVLPRLISPKIALYLWIVVGLLMLGTGVGWWVEYPVYQSTVALEITQASESLSFLVLIPKGAEVNIGQEVVVTVQDEQLNGEITQISEEMSPATIRQNYDLELAQAMVVAGPTRIAIVTIDNIAQDRDSYDGGIFGANVAIKSQKVITLLPVVGKYLEE